MKTAVIFGVAGQIGSYMADYLLTKDYFVVGLTRSSTTNYFNNIQHLVDEPRFTFYECDITEADAVNQVLDSQLYDGLEVYNFAAQSHVATSFVHQASAVNSIVHGTLNILNYIKRHKDNDIRFYHSSSSEMFGDSPGPQNEMTTFLPNSPYAVAKLAAHNMVQVYRKAYGLHVNNGILFNTESPRRGNDFVTRKITQYVAALLYDLAKGDDSPKLKLGNIFAWRDWGHAKDAVRAMHLMLQADEPDDYVIGTGKVHTVEDFLNKAFSYIKEDYHEYIDIDASLYRPREVPFLQADNKKIKEKLGWEPTVTFEDLVYDMLNSDIKKVCRDG